MNRPIGVFDSGMGGLSILKELRRLLPNENFLFLADQRYVPYGEKTKKELVERTSRITELFISQNAKLIVAACNTATCYAIDALRAKYQIPFVGTVPAVKPACQKSKTGVVGIISTPATSKSQALKKLIRIYGRNMRIINIGCKNLEDAVENGKLGSSETKRLLEKYLLPIRKSKADYLVLGCTHYPFLKFHIRKTIGRPIKLLDSGLAVASRTKDILYNSSLINSGNRKGKIIYLTTGNPDNFSRVASELLKTSVLADRVKI